MALSDHNTDNDSESNLRAIPFPKNPVGAPSMDEEDFDEIEAGSSYASAIAWTGLLSKIAAGLIAACILIGWPVGTMLAHMEQAGQFKFLLGYDFPIVFLGLAIPVLVLFLGHVLTWLLRIIARADVMENAARALTQPETRSIEGVRSVGSAVREEISHLNANLDDALSKLATAESMIRQQVKAIETARSAIENDSTGLSDSVARERENLMQLTEAMSDEADAFAAAIAEKAQSSLEQSREIAQTLGTRETDLQDRLGSLEATAERAFACLEKLSVALEQQHASFERNAQSAETEQNNAEEITKAVTERLSENSDALAKAKANLEEESARLEDLISEQRERADRLAEVISQQSERLSLLNQKYEVAEQAAAAHAERVEIAAQAAEKAEQSRQSSRLSLKNISSEDENTLSDASDATPPAQPHPSGGFENFLRDIAGRKAEIKSTPQPKTLRETRHGTSWADILAAADDDKETLNLQPKDMLKTSSPDAQAETDDDNPFVSQDVVQRIRKMQRFTLYLIEEIYGTPPSATIERFEGGERNIFAHLLLRRNEEDVKLRIQNQAHDDLSFREASTRFLTEFDTLLEPATGATNSETLLDDYLASPLGQVYIIVGSALDYFA